VVVEQGELALPGLVLGLAEKNLRLFQGHAGHQQGMLAGSATATLLVVGAGAFVGAALAQLDADVVAPTVAGHGGSNFAANPGEVLNGAVMGTLLAG